MKKRTQYQWLISVALILLIGLTIGYSLGHFQGRKASFPDFEAVEDINPGTPTIKLMKVAGGKLYGELTGEEIRLAYSPDDILTLNEGDSFEVPLNQITLSHFYSTRELPEGTSFISSKQGKYYYHVLDPKAFKITPKNRVYFKNEQQAIASGYQAK